MIDKDDQYLTATQVRERFGRISDMTLWRWLHDEELGFPKPITIQRRRFFKISEIEEFEVKVRQQMRAAADAMCVTPYERSPLEEKYR